MMRTVVIAVAILLMAAFFGCGVASADWSPPDLPYRMQQFLQTQSQWEPAPTGTLGSQWKLPPTAPPESEWTEFTKGACALAGFWLPLKGEEWAAEKLVTWGKVGKFLAPIFGKSVEVAVDNGCRPSLDNARKLLSHLWRNAFG
jgi:hypothetical protein